MTEQLDDWPVLLGLTRSAALLNPCHDSVIKLPRIHDNEKFPELGDEEIVGPMSVAPGPPVINTTGHAQRDDGRDHPRRSMIQKKRAVVEFFRSLVRD